MTRLIQCALLLLLVACSAAPPREGGGCIVGDPGGSMACQAETYKQAR